MSERKWVDLREAIRIVVRLNAGGERLARCMTDKWLAEGDGRYPFEECVDGPNLFLADRYHPLMPADEDWQLVRLEMWNAFEPARKTLTDVLSTGAVDGDGQIAGEPRKRRIMPSEWDGRKVDFGRNMLPATSDLPAITSIRVLAADVSRECRGRARPALAAKTEPERPRTSPALPSAKRSCVVKALERRGYYPNPNGMAIGDLVTSIRRECAEFYPDDPRGRGALRKMVQRVLADAP
jgi:hypothetical protein